MKDCSYLFCFKSDKSTFTIVFLNEEGVLINMVNGIVKWFSDRKGVGFISQETGEDVFCTSFFNPV